MLLPIRRRNKKEIKKNQRDKKFSQGEGKKISAQAKKAYVHGGVDVAYRSI
jgi:ribosome recycling factor